MRSTTLNSSPPSSANGQHADDDAGHDARAAIQHVAPAVARARELDQRHHRDQHDRVARLERQSTSTIARGEQRRQHDERQPRRAARAAGSRRRPRATPSAVDVRPVVATAPRRAPAPAAGPTTGSQRRERRVAGEAATRALIVSAAALLRARSRPCRRRSGRGDHQFQRPSSAISDGTSSVRTTNASISTPVAVATPICWMNEIELVLKAPIATASRIAAAVTTRPVRGEAGGDRLALGQRRRRAPP